jgi:hypothetical protein
MSGPGENKNAPTARKYRGANVNHPRGRICKAKILLKNTFCGTPLQNHFTVYCNSRKENLQWIYGNFSIYRLNNL